MLAREIGTDDLRADVAGGEIHFHAFPATLPFRVGEEAIQHFGVEIALAIEITVETAMGQSRSGHNLLDGDTLKAVAIEELARAFNDGFLDYRAMTRRVRHGGSLFVALSMPRRMVSCQQKIILNIFWTGGLMRCGRVKTRWRTKMSERTNLMAMMNLPTRRQVITGVAAAAGVFALGSTGAWAGAEEEVSRTAESIHMEPVFKASRKRVYEALTETKQFDKVINLSAAIKSGVPPDAKPTEISREAGVAFSLFGGYVTGRHI